MPSWSPTHGNSGFHLGGMEKPGVSPPTDDQVATIPNLSNPVHFVPVDFRCQRLNEELAHAPGFDPQVGGGGRRGWKKIQ